MSVRIGSLFSGAGALDVAVERVFSGRTVWHCERDAAASKVLAARWPDVPNLGDISAVDWSAVELIDVLCGGFPCQDVSSAGRRAGLREGTRSGLWSVFADAIAALRPQVVVIENVRGLLSAKSHRAMESDSAGVGDGRSGLVLRAAGAVLGELADLGYDAQWATVAASDAGACHRRQRVFIVAHPANAQSRPWWLVDRNRHGFATDEVSLLPTPVAVDANGARNSTANRRNPVGVHLGDTLGDVIFRGDLRCGAQWGKYGTAVRRWEALTRPAPSPTEPNIRGKPRLHAPFSEWMMGWPAGWCTDVDGIKRNDALRIIGNGVVPQQAEAAIRYLLNVAAIAA